MKLKSSEFRGERERIWKELDHLVSRVEKGGIRCLSTDDLTRLPALYRATLSSLSVARSISTDRNLIDFLESLSARAYIHVYGAKQGAVAMVFSFFAVTFPASVRRFRWHVLLASVFLISGTVAGFLLTMDEPDRYYTFVDSQMVQGRTPAATTESLREILYDETDHGASLVGFTSMLFTNNSQVGFRAYVFGFLAGLPVFLVLFVNGLMLGAFGALHEMRGLSADFWGWVLPHGITEFLAIILCGAAGLVIGQALLFPGAYRRIPALARAGRRSGALVLGAIALFLVAGLIEGIFRQTVHDMTVRYGLATLTAVGWTAYFLFAGRGRS